MSTRSPVPERTDYQKNRESLALRRIAILLGSRLEWDGADELEEIADLIASAGLPHPGGDDNVALYRRAANL